MAVDTAEVVIIGGGIMGAATAYYLKRGDSGLRVTVVEPDPAYERASTTLSVSNVRVQFSLEENIRISLFTLEVLRSFGEEMAVGDRKPQVGFRPEGNLFLVGEADRLRAEAAYRLQRSLGCRVEWWTPADIRRAFPLYQPEGLIGGTFSAEDGHFDAYALLMGYKAKAKDLGTAFLQDEVRGVTREKGRVTGVRLASGNAVAASAVVNCAGAWAARVAKTAGVDIPVRPVKRQVFVADPRVKPEGPLPLTVLPSGLYFRTDTGGCLLVGKSLPEDPVGFDFTWEDQRFTDRLWPELAEFVPAFDTLKLVRGWAGLYAVNTLDGNAILGEWPELAGFYLANGFSGHGLQQGPAVGRYIAERILGRPPVLDLSVFSPARILEGRPLSEAGLV